MQKQLIPENNQCIEPGEYRYHNTDIFLHYPTKVVSLETPKEVRGFIKVRDLDFVDPHPGRDTLYLHEGELYLTNDAAAPYCMAPKISPCIVYFNMSGKVFVAFNQRYIKWSCSTHKAESLTHALALGRPPDFQDIFAYKRCWKEGYNSQPWERVFTNSSYDPRERNYLETPVYVTNEFARDELSDVTPFTSFMRYVRNELYEQYSFTDVGLSAKDINILEPWKAIKPRLCISDYRRENGLGFVDKKSRMPTEMGIDLGRITNTPSLAETYCVDTILKTKGFFTYSMPDIYLLPYSWVPWQKDMSKYYDAQYLLVCTAEILNAIKLGCENKQLPWRARILGAKQVKEAYNTAKTHRQECLRALQTAALISI